VASVAQAIEQQTGDAALTFVVLNTGAAVVFANFISARKAVWGR